MPYENKTCTANSSEADSIIVDLYPEIRIWNPTYDDTETDDSLLAFYQVAESIGMTMDILALDGRLLYVITLLDPDHGAALQSYLTTALVNTGYTAKNTGTTVTVSCGSC